MITYRYKVSYLLLVLFITVLGFGFLVLSALMLRALVLDFDAGEFVGCLLFVYMGAGALYVSLGSVVKVNLVLEDKVLVIGSNGLLSRSVNLKDLKGYKFFTHRTKFKTYRAFFIETVSGSQLTFTAMQLADFNGTVVALKEVLPRNGLLKKNIWNFVNYRTTWQVAFMAVVIYIAVFFDGYLSQLQ
jgi:hypothetical protein